MGLSLFKRLKLPEPQASRKSGMVGGRAEIGVYMDERRAWWPKTNPGPLSS